MAEFRTWLNEYEAKLRSSESRYAKALENLHEAKDGLATLMKKHGINVDLEEGGAVNLGQQYKLKLVLPQGFHEHILFRAYVAGDGTINFDFYDEDVTSCDGIDRAVVLDAVEKFLERESTVGAIQQLMNIAGKTPVAALKDRIERDRARKRSRSASMSYRKSSGSAKASKGSAGK